MQDSLHIFTLLIKEDLSAFVAWERQRRELLKSCEYISRRTQSAKRDSVLSNVSWDVAEELWTERMQMKKASDILFQANNPPSHSSQKLYWPTVEQLFTTDHVVLDKRSDSPLTKVFASIKRKPTLSLVEFRTYWKEVHGPIVSELPELETYVQCSTVDDAYSYTEPLWDGIAILATSNFERCVQMLTSATFASRARPHADKFLERIALGIFSEVQSEAHSATWIVRDLDADRG
jgi:EthD domain